MTLLQYWKEHFGNQAAVMAACLPEMDSLTSSWGFSFSDVAGNLPFISGEKYTVPMSLIEKTNGKTKDSVAIYSNIKVFRNGIEFPEITVTRKGGEKLPIFSFYQYIVDEYERSHKGENFQNGTLTNQAKEDRKKKNELLLEQFETNKKANHLRQAIENEKNKTLHFDYLELFNSSPKANGRSKHTTYAREKGIVRALAACGAKQFNDSHLVSYGRDLMAVKFRNAYRADVGFQKIYSDGRKQQSDSFTEKTRSGPQFNGAFVPFGNLDDDPETIQYCEGLATAASCYLSNKALTLFCINADNMMIVVSQMLALYPDAKHVVLADNDNEKYQQGKGNKGVKIAHQIKGTFRDRVRVVVAQTEGEGTDFNDIHQSHKDGLREVAKQIKGRKGVVKNASDIFQQSLTELHYTNPDIFPKKAENAKEIKKAVNAGLALYPRFYTKEAITLALTNSISHFKTFPLTDVLKMIDRRCYAKRVTAQKARGFSKETISDPQINYKRFNEGFITPEVLAYLNGLEGQTILRAPMASGKTQVFIKSAFRKKFDLGFAGFSSASIKDFEDDLYLEFLNYMKKIGPPSLAQIATAKARISKEVMEHCARVEQNHNRNMRQRFSVSAYLAHRRTLVGSAATDLSDDREDEDGNKLPGPFFTVSHYQDDKGLIKSGGQLETLACCANSITNPIFESFFAGLDQLFIDEGSQTVRHICSGGAVDNPKLVFDKLVEIVRCTPTVVFCDADADDLLVEFCKIATPDKIINIVELTTDCTHLTINVTETKNIYTRILSDLKADEKVLMATDNANFAENLADTIKQEFGDKKKVLFISADTKHQEHVSKFCDAANVEGEQYDVIIYSPAISSGVSFQWDYWLSWNTYAAFYGVVSPSDAIQMIRRNRKATSFTIGLGAMNSREVDNEDELLLGMAADNGEVPEINREEFTISTTFTPFDSLRAKVLAMEGKLRNDFANIFLLSLMSDGYQINHLDKDLSSEKSASDKMKEAKARLTDSKHLRFELNETPSKDLNSELMRKKGSAGLTADEKTQCDRYNIENLLQMEVNPDTIKIYENGGMRKAANYDLINMASESSSAIDKQEIENNVPKTMRQRLTQRKELTRQLIKRAGFDVDNFSGEVTAGQIKAAIDWLREDKTRLAHYNSFLSPGSIGPYINPYSTKQQPTTVFDGILSRLGLKTTKAGRKTVDGRKQTVRAIDGDLLALANQTHEKRKAANVQSHYAKKGVSDGKVEDLIIFDDSVKKDGENEGHTLGSVLYTNSKEYVHSLDLAVVRVIENLKVEKTPTFLEARRLFSRDTKKAYEGGKITYNEIFDHIEIAFDPSLIILKPQKSLII